MNKGIYCSVITFLLLVVFVNINSCSKQQQIPVVSNQSVTSNVSDRSADSDIIGKIIVGYQGWFSAQGDGSPCNYWNHQNIELWPDTRDYSQTYAGSPFFQNGGYVISPFYGNLNNDKPAVMFSSYDYSTVMTHFSWMKQYGIDGVALQRYGSELSDPSLKAQRDGMIAKVSSAAQATGRKFYIMYDITGWTDFQTEIKTDWLSDIHSVVINSSYAYQDGKPVVCIWGVGVSGRPGDVNSWTDVLSWFKSQGCFVIVGTSADFSTDVINQKAYNTADMIMPWRVGNYGDPSLRDQKDLAYCSGRNIDYQVDIFPGYAFSNSDLSKPRNEIPRKGGSFMWSQFVAATNNKVKSVYISMFDEINEATAIFKCAEDKSMVPAGNYFLTLDADGTHVSSDFYLRLTNDGGQMLKGLKPYTAVLPTPFQ